MQQGYVATNQWSQHSITKGTFIILWRFYLYIFLCCGRASGLLLCYSSVFKSKFLYKPSLPSLADFKEQTLKSQSIFLKLIQINCRQMVASVFNFINNILEENCLLKGIMPLDDVFQLY